MIDIEMSSVSIRIKLELKGIGVGIVARVYVLRRRVVNTFGRPMELFALRALECVQCCPLAL